MLTHLDYCHSVGKNIEELVLVKKYLYEVCYFDGNKSKTKYVLNNSPDVFDVLGQYDDADLIMKANILDFITWLFYYRWVK